MEKLEWCGYPVVKKIDIMHERGTHTERERERKRERERQTDTQTPHDGIGRTYA